MGESWRKWQFIQDLLVVTIGPVMLYYLVRKVLTRHEQGQDNPEITKRLEGILADRDQEQEDYEFYQSGSESDSEDETHHADSKTSQSQSHPRRTARHPKDRTRNLDLNTYEQSIASEVVQPSSIPITFADIGGLDAIISDLQESVIYPLTLPSLYTHSSSLLSAPSGVLLYGPPGCGKTMLAKALARESNAVFINLHISTLTNKWYGDSNKLVAAVFSLARKLAPAIVFVDEIDAVLGTRRQQEHEASGMVKAEMMTHWDGLTSADADGKPQRILILGATNRPNDIDEAILRRMPKRFAIGLPDAEQRRRIFQLVLKDTKVDDEAYGEDRLPPFSLEILVRASEGMSGSDIKEACREAAMAPMREFLQKRKAAGRSIRGVRAKELRGLRTGDFAGLFDRARAVGNGRAVGGRAVGGAKQGKVVEWTSEESAEDDDGSSAGEESDGRDDGEARRKDGRKVRRRKGSRKGGNRRVDGDQVAAS